MNAPSFTDLLAEFRISLGTLRSDITAAEGDISLMLGDAATAMADRIIGYAADRYRATFLDGAKGADLTARAADRSPELERLPASKATGTANFSRPTAGAGAVSIPTGTIVATNRDSDGNEVRIVTTAVGSMGIGVLTAAVPAEVEQAGRAGNIAAGTLGRVVSTLTDSTIVVTNAALFAGGAEEESDDDLRERARRFPQTVRRGTAEALEYMALLVAGVAKAVALEDEGGIATLYVTDSAGGSSAPMLAAAESLLPTWRAAGAIVNVTGGVLVLVDVGVTLTVRVGFSVAERSADIEAAIRAAVRKLRVGDDLVRDLISQAVRNVDNRITRCVVTLDGEHADLAPNAGEIFGVDVVSIA